MTTINKVVASLHEEYSRLQKEMGQVRSALDALGHTNGNRIKGIRRTLSPEARARIAAAQKLRWAKVRKAAKQAKS
jgi:hypothetical protein